MEESLSEESTSEKNTGAGKRFLISLVRIILIVVAIVGISVVLTDKVFSAYKVSGDAMEPGLTPGEVVVCLKTTDVTRGDVVVLNEDGKLLIRRVIGLGGDTVDIGEDGMVAVNGSFIDESYVDTLTLGKTDITLPVTVPDGEVFLLGDNRQTAIDSRVSVFGTVRSEEIAGKVLFHLPKIGD